MEQKRTKLMLGILLVFVWGLLVYKIYQRIKPANNVIPVIKQQPSFVIPVSSDSFDILLNYPDPFLSGKPRINRRSRPINSNATNQNSVNIVPKNRRINSTNRPSKSISFPLVKYQGTIKVKNKRLVALLSINNQMTNLSEGEKLKNITLKKIYADSVRISFQGNEKTILKVK